MLAMLPTPIQETHMPVNAAVPVDASAFPSSTAEIVNSLASGKEVAGWGELPDEEGESAHDFKPLPLDGSDAEPEQQEGQPEEGKAEEAKPEEPKPAQGQPVVVKDAEGKAYKLKLDLSKPEHVQKLAQQAFEGRTLKAEVEQLRAKAAEASEYKTEMAEMESVLEERGLPGLVDFLLEKEGSFESYVEQERQRRNLLDSSTPEERAAALKIHELEERERKASAREKRLAAKDQQASEKLSQAQVEQQQAMYNNAWGKHELGGKLGDADLEERLNKAAHSAISAEVDELQRKGVKLSQADYNRLVEREFSILQRGFKGAADREAKRETQAKQAEASKALEARSSAAAPVRGGAQSDAVKQYASGNIGMRGLISRLLGG